MKKILLVLICIIVILSEGCSTQLPTIEKEEVQGVYVLFGQGTNLTWEQVERPVFVGQIISYYNESKVDSNQTYETTPTNQFKVVLYNGDSFVMMDADGPRALVILPDGKNIIVSGKLGAFIENY